MQMEKKGSGPWPGVEVDGVNVTLTVGDNALSFDCAGERLIVRETSRMYWCRVWRNYGMKAWWWSRRQEIRDRSRGA